MQPKKWLSLLLTLALTLTSIAAAATGESAPDPAGELIGVWQVDWTATVAAGGETGFGDGSVVTIRFRPDGKCIQILDGKVLNSGDYIVSGDTITLRTEYDSELISFTIDGDVLTLAGDNEGEILVFNRIHEPAAPSADALIGAWEVNWAKTIAAGGEADPFFEDAAVIYEFGADGAFTATQGDEEMVTGEYTVSGDTLTLHSKYDSELINFTIDGDVLTMSDGRETFVFDRVRESGASPADALTGAWAANWAKTIAAGGDADSFPGEDTAVIFAFGADGAFTATQGDEEMVTGVYTVSGHTITIDTGDDSTEIDFQIDGDELTLFDKRETFVFDRVRESAAPPADAVAGVWEIDWAASTILDDDGFLFEGWFGMITFNPDGTCVLYMDLLGMVTEPTPGIYVVAGDTMATYMEPDLELYRFMIDGDTLTLTEAITGEVLVLHRPQKPPEALLGIWEADWEASVAAGADDYFDEDSVVTFEFRANGLFALREGDQAFVFGEYTVSGNALTLDADDFTQELRFKADGDTLTLYGENEGEVIVFNKWQ
ncbi:MAG: lipocalin family protein [Clostridia bacterium]|nr:lipocalin family protein [Clostridia bacterium]